MKKGVTMGKGKTSGGDLDEKSSGGGKMEAMAKTLPFLAMPNDEKKDVVKAEDKVGRTGRKIPRNLRLSSRVNQGNFVAV